jgi:methylmalonyl-CoA/ethylmalonyl-CoA epimerase
VILGVSHIGIAVPDVDAASAHWTRLLGTTETHRVDARSQGVIAAFIPVGNTELELIQPTGPSSGVGRFVARQGRAAIHHVCLQVDDTVSEVRRLEAAGARLLTPGAQVDSEGPYHSFAWLHQDSFGGVLVELVQHRS